MGVGEDHVGRRNRTKNGWMDGKRKRNDRNGMKSIIRLKILLNLARQRTGRVGHAHSVARGAHESAIGASKLAGIILVP